MTANPLRGEIAAELGGETRTLRLGMNELAAIEADTGVSIGEMAQALSRRGIPIRQMQSLLYHGLAGGGWKGARTDAAGLMAATGYLPCMKVCRDLLGAALSVGVGDDDPNRTAGASPAA